MRKLVLSVILSLSFLLPATAQQNDIQGVISAQIEAFKADDFAAAFEFAAPSIRNIFRTPDNFGRMVVQGYPMVWRPAQVTYLDLRQDGPAWWQVVEIEDAAGVVHVLGYRMIETPDGWKISGVQILKRPGVAA